MRLVRPVANTGHAVGWTVFISSVALTIYGVTRNRPVFRRFTRFWAEVCAAGWGMQVRAHGITQLDPRLPYVFMANHLSHVDIVALFVALPIDVGFLAKKELRKVPFLAQAMIAGGHVFIDRSRRESAVNSLSQAALEVRNGASLVIFPEGTRGGEETIKPFKTGGFHLARQAGVPIVPVGLRGTRTIMPRESLTIQPGGVEVHVGTPIDPNAFAGVVELSAHVRARIAELAQMPCQPGSHPGNGKAP
jgi:1-acyl-sn-glycerol-3-phosphate acyltransferase